ncbi:consortin, connexin sorting protein b isoform X2 [Electrophorus electricus]|nr:consortin, connexin sorting protein b isoform X2 [Electrophorus electricus]XP_026871749.2 consortin, connexin sorting protein b isoform X2 [Electrophorus electricus]XP_026871750.2 consortin, connexin sorting protein b isoform X2 [Electrophorus electricus]
MEPGAIDLGAVPEDIRSENPDEKPGLEPTRWSRSPDERPGLEPTRWSRNPDERPGLEPTIFPLDSSGLGAFCRAPGPSPSLLASLRSLAEHSNHMLLPHSLHQIAESYFLEEDYPWAVQFLRLEQLYHERLISNLTSLQEEWESQWKSGTTAGSSTPMNTQGNDAESKCMDSLSQICQTHQRPNRTGQGVVDLATSPTPAVGERRSVEETPRGYPARWEEKENESSLPRSEPEEGMEDEEEELEEDFGEEFGEEDDGLTDELQDDLATAGLASGEELVKPVLAQQSVPSKGLVSILRKSSRHCGAGITNHVPPKGSYRRKVRFSEMDNTLDTDEVGGASCLLFFLLCLVTTVISMGGTAIFCLMGGAYSNVCTDFSQNMDFYFGPVRRGMDTLTHWFTPTSSSP